MATYLPGSKAVGGTTSTATAWINEVWANEFDVLAYEEAVGYPNFTEFPPLHGRMHVPKIDNLSRVSLGDATAGNNLTFSANTETELLFTPSTTVVPVEVNLPAIVRAMKNPQDALKKACEMSIAEGIDQSALTLAGLLTTNVVDNTGLNIDRAAILDADQKLAAGAKGYYRAGASGGIMIVGVAQKDDILTISEITSAQVRGDSANPTVTGWVAQAYGISFYESGNVQISGAVLNNVLFIKRAFAISFNQRPTVFTQGYQMVNRIFCWADFGYGTVRDQYAVLIKTLAS